MPTNPAFELIADEPDFLVIHKYPNVAMHQSETGVGLIDLIRDTTGYPLLHQVHRLDNLTSGVMVYAKSAEVAAELSAAWQSHAVQKYYLAISTAKPNRKQGLIKGDMEKGRGGSWKLLRSQAQPAVTQFFSTSLQPGVRAFLLKPQTGKTHQIRVAMKSLASPILGDERYGGDAADRGYLHAYQLTFPLASHTYCYRVLPCNGKHFLQAEMQQLLSADWRQPDLLVWPNL